MFQIVQAAPARGHLDPHPLVNPPLFSERRAECSDDVEIADDIDKFPVHRGGLSRIFVVALRPPPGEMENDRAEHQSDAQQRPRQGQIDRTDEGNCKHQRHGRRQHVPRRGVLHCETCIGGRGDPAGECTRQALGEVGRCVATEMAEQVATDVSGDCDERAMRRIGADAPEKIVGRDQTAQQGKRAPDLVARRLASGRDNIDEILHAVLRGHAARHRHQHR